MGAGVTLMLGAVSAVQAMPIDTGNEDLTVNFDNTVKYSGASRVKSAIPALLGNPNTDDGDRNFGKGLISNRMDLLSEFDMVYAKRYGLRLSGAAWYDSVYNRSNDNPGFAGGAFPNQISVPYNEFTDATRDLHGRKAEMLDAFVFGSFDVGDKTVSMRLGRHSLLWGESLFLGNNAIAGTMSPVDVVKLASVPNTQFKEAIRPVPQWSGSIQLASTLSVGAFYQFGWQPYRLPAVGSYFSAVDMLPDGGEQLLLGPGLAAPRFGDQKPKDSGQGGLQLRLRADETDYGLYLVRFHSKVPQMVLMLGPSPFGAVPFGYRLAYQEGITAFGASASRTFGDLNLAAEASIRHNQDLASSRAVDASALAPGVIAPTNNSNNPAYAVGNTAHMNLNAIWTLPRTPLFAEGTLMGELGWNRALSVTKNAAALDPNATRDAWGLRMQVEPMYRQVVGGLDLGVPIGVGYSPRGSRSMALGPAAWTPDGGGDVTIGLNGTYLDVWRFSLAYTHYFGSAGSFINSAGTYSYAQALRDRDFIAFSLRRTF
ncbi:Protein of unknown function [Variovorax sp. HW608]|uniref:DUF1302 domain-containing protein n=1 Tax=Variovorax sp. HW608 TaxID=1034889 RepID=UPI00081FC823|nr:Protein of unknown function [Variovorax sp. HW608]